MENLKVTESGLVYISQNNEIVCDSLQVAKKFRKRHNNVMRDIRGLLKNEQTQTKCLILVVIQKNRMDKFTRCIL